MTTWWLEREAQIEAARIEAGPPLAPEQLPIPRWPPPPLDWGSEATEAWGNVLRQPHSKH